MVASVIVTTNDLPASALPDNKYTLPALSISFHRESLHLNKPLL